MRTSKLQEQIIEILKEMNGYTFYNRRIFNEIYNRSECKNKRVLSASISRALKTLEKQGRIKLVRREYNDEENNIIRKQNNYCHEKYFSIELLNVNLRTARMLTDIKANSTSEMARDNKNINVNCTTGVQLTDKDIVKVNCNAPQQLTISKMGQVR